MPIIGLVLILVALGITSAIEWNPAPLRLVDIHIFLSALGLGFIFILVLRIRQQMIKPLRNLRKWSQRIRAGDLETLISLPADGEFADLIQDINHLTEELHVLTEEMDFKVRAQTEHIANKSRSLEILYDVATSLSEAHGLDEILEQFLDTLMILVDAKAASVRLLTSDDQTRLVASRGFTDFVIKREELVDVNRCLCGEIAQRGGLGIQRGIRQCNKFLPCAIVEGECEELVVVPLQYQERILGVYNLFLARPSSELGKDARDLLNSIGKHLGLAVEKTILDDAARRLAIMEERNMLGNELHDSLAQSLVSMRFQIKMLGENLHKKEIRAAQNEVRQLSSAIEEAHVSLRDLLANFKSRMDERGLVPAIDDLVSRFRDDTSITTFFQNECGTDKPNIPLAQEIQAFRIVQESLSNIRKHSNACNLRILFTKNNDEYSILIEDDGHGIVDQPESDNPGEHVGLSIMQERASHIGGRVTIESEPGEGTRVCLTFPATLDK